MREDVKEISPEELEELHESLSKGLRQMLDFERKLNGYDRETLCLFLTLMTARESYPEVLQLLDNLSPMSRRSRPGGEIFDTG